MGYHLVARTLHINHFYDLLFFTIYFTSRPKCGYLSKETQRFSVDFSFVSISLWDFCKLQHYLGWTSDAGLNNCRTPADGLWGIVIKGNS